MNTGAWLRVTYTTLHLSCSPSPAAAYAYPEAVEHMLGNSHAVSACRRYAFLSLGQSCMALKFPLSPIPPAVPLTGHFSTSTIARAAAGSDTAGLPHRKAGEDETEDGGLEEEDASFDDPRIAILDAALGHVEIHG